jgi:hypothetical protein
MKFSIISIIACAGVALAAPVVEVSSAAVLKRTAIPAGGTSAFQQACQVAGGDFNCCTNTNSQTPGTGLLGLPLNLNLQCTFPPLSFPLILPG